MSIKIVIGEKSGKSLQKEVEDSKFLNGLKINDTFKGESIDMTGYEFQITGGSDVSGFPMRSDVRQNGRRKILATSGTGVNPARKGLKIRKSVAGSIIGDNIAQLNVKVTKYGANPLFEEPAAEATETTEAAEEKAE